VWSSRPALDPASTSTRLAASAAARTDAAILSASSGCTSLASTRAPARAARAASMIELLSTMSPRRSGVPTGRISSPVGMIATVGWRAVHSVAWPAVAAAARSAGRSRRPAGMSSSPAGKSSPHARTFRPRGAGPVITAAPSARIVTRSRSTTVSMPSGIGSPVSTQVKAVGGSVHDATAALGTPGSPAAIAMPSIAAQSHRGDGQRASTSSAVTRPSAAATGTRSDAGPPRHPAAEQAAVHRAYASRGLSLGAFTPRPGVFRCRRSSTGRAGSRPG
jgi:hypothetical protein